MARPDPEAFIRRVTRRIRAARTAKRITQEAMADALGTATGNVQRIEAGQNLTLHTVARIAHVLGVSPEELVTGEQARGSRGARARRRA